MIHHIRGRLTQKEAGRREGGQREPSAVVVEANGVGYRALVSAATLSALPATGEETTLLTHLVVREDAVELVGFSSQEERHLFHLLLSVNSVGPRLALAVLGLGADALRRAVAFGHAAALQSVPGVGKKTAERLVLELRDRLGVDMDSPAAAGSPPDGDPYREAGQALEQLGYAPVEAARAVAAVRRPGEAPPVEDVLREALRHLAGSPR